MADYRWTDSRENLWAITLDGPDAHITRQSRGKPNEPVVQCTFRALDLRDALVRAHMTGQTSRVGNVSVVSSIIVRGSNGNTGTTELWSIRAVTDNDRLFRVDLRDTHRHLATPQHVYNKLFAAEQNITDA